MKKEKATKMTLGEFHKKRIISHSLVLLMIIFKLITEHLITGDKLWIKTISLVLSVTACLFLIYFNVISRNIDKEDEFARENMFKAHDRISKIFIALFFVGILFIISVRGETFTIKFNTETLLDLWLSIYMCYFILESGFYLHYEGKFPNTEEEE